MKISSALIKSRRYKKAVDIKPEGEKSTTTPKMHFTNKQPITELEINSELKLKIRPYRNPENIQQFHFIEWLLLHSDGY